MADEFTLPVDYDGEKLELPARLSQYGFTIRVEVLIEKVWMVFEPDEERNWRAIMGFEDLFAGNKIKPDLLKAVAEVLEELTK